MPRPRTVEINYCLDGLDLIVRCSVRLGTPNPGRPGTGWVPADAYPEVEIMDVWTDAVPSVLVPEFIPMLEASHWERIEALAVSEVTDLQAMERDRRAEEARERSEW